MTVGSPKSHACITTKLADKIKCIVISIDYRLAPEFEYPAAHHDLYDVLEYFCEDQYEKDVDHIVEKLGGKYDMSRLALCGDSAGATLIGALCFYARERKVEIKHQILVYPCIYYNGVNPLKLIPEPTDSFVKYRDGPLLTAPSIKFSIHKFFGGDQRQALTGALIYTPLHLYKDLPNTTIICARFDPLRDEGYDFYKHMQLHAPNAKINFKEYDSIHGFFGIDIFDYGRESIDYAIEVLKDSLYK